MNVFALKKSGCKLLRFTTDGVWAALAVMDMLPGFNPWASCIHGLGGASRVMFLTTRGRWCCRPHELSQLTAKTGVREPVRRIINDSL